MRVEVLGVRLVDLRTLRVAADEVDHRLELADRRRRPRSTAAGSNRSAWTSSTGWAASRSRSRSTTHVAVTE